LIKATDRHSTIDQKRSALDRGIAFFLLRKFAEPEELNPAGRAAKHAREQASTNKGRTGCAINHSQTERSELGVEISAVYPADEILAPHDISEIFGSARIIDQMERRSFVRKGCDIDRCAFVSRILKKDVPMLNRR